MRTFLILPADAPAGLPSAPDPRASPLLRLGAPAENAARKAARARVRDFILARRAHDPAFYVQLAPVGSAIFEADLDALAGAWPDGVFLEGCEAKADVQRLSVKLAVREAVAGVAQGATKIVALAAQTPAGVFALGAYRGASARLAGLALDETRLPGGESARSAARGLLILGAAAAGVPAMEIAPSGSAGLAAACAAARADGFSGMLARVADQIATIESTFAES